MENSSAVKILVDNEKGLTADERAKLVEGTDSIYIDSRLDFHKRLARRQVASFVLLILFALFAFGVVMFPNTDFTAGLLKGLVVGYFAALLIIVPKTTKNHSRIAFVISVVKQINSPKQA
ncbi:MAG: hypothetical protein AB1777_02010 [Bacteroidota bacterium]